MSKLPSKVRIPKDWETFRRSLAEVLEDTRAFLAALPKVKVLVFKDTIATSLEGVEIQVGFTPKAVLLSRASKTNGALQGSSYGIDWYPVNNGFVIRDFTSIDETIKYTFSFLCVG